jgi:hypothetical protein
LKNRPLDPRKTFGLLKVFGSPETFFQKGFWPSETTEETKHERKKFRWHS